MSFSGGGGGGDSAGSPRSGAKSPQGEVDPELNSVPAFSPRPSSVSEASGAVAAEALRTGKSVGEVKSKVPFVGGEQSGKRNDNGRRKGRTYWADPPMAISLTEMDEWGLPIM